MMCDLKSDKQCALEVMFADMKEQQTAFEVRQKSFEDRQAKNEINIANLDRNIAHLQKDMSETNLELKAMSSRVHVNTEQLVDIKNDIKPITDGVGAIYDAMKPWIWIYKKIKWIGTTILAGWIIFMDGYTHLMDLIHKSNH